MDEQMLEFFRRGQISLPDDVILYLVRHFLSPQDSLYLALSRVSIRFNELYGNRSRLDISRCFRVSLVPWQTFFQQHNFAPNLTVFNASSCYWLPASALSHSITLMTSMVELSVEDTEIQLTHFPQIFGACPKLVKLSFTLLENKLDQLEESVMGKKAHDLLKQGFGNLTSLKIFTIPSDTSHCVEVWLAIFEVLKWCQHCIHLMIDSPFTPSVGEDYSTTTSLINKANLASQELLPHLEWLRSLKTLAIFRHDHRFVWSDDGRGTAIKILLNIFLNENCWPGESLESYWVEFNSTDDSTEDRITSPIVKSLLLSYSNNAEMLHEHDRFRYLEHLGEADFSDSFPFDDLPCLKYIQGRVTNIQVFNKFCELHPMLEYLHIAIYADDFSGDVENPVLFHGKWNLLHLKKLVYIGDYWPLEQGEFETRIFEACPNIQELHMGISLETQDSINFFSKIQLKHLTTLTLYEVSLPFGEILGGKIEEQCPKLKRLHLAGGYDEYHEASRGSGKHIPFVTNLRDLRLKWNTVNLDQVPRLLDDIAGNSPLLERLVVHIECNHFGTWDESRLCIPLEDTIMDAVLTMEHLVLLCLTGFAWSDDIVHGVRQRLTQEVLPLRPALKFYLGEEFPNATDPTFPRIHCNEMIHPQEQYYAPPPISSSL